MEFRYHMQSEFPDLLSAHIHEASYDPLFNDYRPSERLHCHFDNEETSRWYHGTRRNNAEYDAWFQSSYQPYRRPRRWGGRLFDRGPWEWVGDSSAAFPLHDPLQQDFDQRNRPCSPFPSSLKGPFAAHHQRGRPDEWTSFDNHHRFTPFEGNGAREEDGDDEDQESPAYNVDDSGGKNFHPSTGFPRCREDRKQCSTRYDDGSESSHWGPLNKDGRAGMPSPGYCWTLNSSSQSAPASPNPCASQTPKRHSCLDPDEDRPPPVPKRYPDHEPCLQDPPDRMGRDGTLNTINCMKQDLKQGKEYLESISVRVRKLNRKAEELEKRVSKLEEREVR